MEEHPASAQQAAEEEKLRQFMNRENEEKERYEDACSGETQVVMEMTLWPPPFYPLPYPTAILWNTGLENSSDIRKAGQNETICTEELFFFSTC